MLKLYGFYYNNDVELGMTWTISETKPHLICSHDAIRSYEFTDRTVIVRALQRLQMGNAAEAFQPLFTDLDKVPLHLPTLPPTPLHLRKHTMKASEHGKLVLEGDQMRWVLSCGACLSKLAPFSFHASLFSHTPPSSNKRLIYYSRS